MGLRDEAGDEALELGEPEAQLPGAACAVDVAAAAAADIAWLPDDTSEGGLLEVGEAAEFSDEEEPLDEETGDEPPEW